MTLLHAARRSEFRFDADRHEYIDADGCVLPHITGMLERTGWIDATWYTDESSLRGQVVHRLTADYDLGALDLDGYVSQQYRPWLLTYVAASQILKPVHDAVEAPAVHPIFRFGGRPDRVSRIFGIYSILEIKTNNKGWNLEKAHPIQTALQAILVAATRPLPAEAWQRFAIYCRPNGKFRIADHQPTKRKDFDEAYRIIRVCR